MSQYPTRPFVGTIQAFRTNQVPDTEFVLSNLIIYGVVVLTMSAQVKDVSFLQFSTGSRVQLLNNIQIASHFVKGDLFE